MTDHFTLEKLEISIRLGKLEASMEKMIEINQVRIKHTDEFHDTIKKNLEKLNYIITGNGKDEGLAEDVRNLNKSESKRQKHYWALYLGVSGAFIVSIVNFFWNKLIGK